MSFIKAYQELVKKGPAMPRFGLRNEEADFTDYIYRSRNVYYSFSGGNLLDSAYLNDCNSCTDCFDLSFCVDCELCYECTDSFRLYNCGYCYDCSHSSDLLFCYRCRHSSDLFGCAGLAYKKYCIFNRQLTKKEYYKQKAELIKKPPEIHLVRLEELKKKLPRPLNRNSGSENCDFANRSYYSNNLYWCFEARRCQDSAYLTDAEFSQDCFDGLNLHECELCYESHNLGHSYACSFINNGDHLYDCHFCTCCYRSKYLFGCVNLYQAKYCILNKQYKKDEYFAKIRQIKKELGWKPAE